MPIQTNTAAMKAASADVRVAVHAIRAAHYALLALADERPIAVAQPVTENFAFTRVGESDDGSPGVIAIADEDDAVRRWWNLAGRFDAPPAWSAIFDPRVCSVSGLLPIEER